MINEKLTKIFINETNDLLTVAPAAPSCTTPWTGPAPAPANNL